MRGRYPYCHTAGLGDPYHRDVGPGGLVADPELNAGGEGACPAYTAAVQALGPHVAPLGMDFYTADAFPAEYNRSIFIALRGSWNRSKKIGTRPEPQRLTSHMPFTC